MKKFLISLAKDEARRTLFFTQADSQDFVVFEAINTMSETLETLENRFDLKAFEQRYQRKVTKGEVGCTLSHLAVYQKIVEDSQIQEEEYTLICEDDVLFNQHFQFALTQLTEKNPTDDIILLGQSKIATFDDAQLEWEFPTTFSGLMQKIPQTSYRYAYPYRNYYAGTVAYLIKKRAARKFLDHLDNHKPYWLADDFILFGGDFGEFLISVVRPLLAIENPALMSNLEGARGSVQQSGLKVKLKYPLKKLLAIKRNF